MQLRLGVVIASNLFFQEFHLLFISHIQQFYMSHYLLLLTLSVLSSCQPLTYAFFSSHLSLLVLLSNLGQAPTSSNNQRYCAFRLRGAFQLMEIQRNNSHFLLYMNVIGSWNYLFAQQVDSLLFIAVHKASRSCFMSCKKTYSCIFCYRSSSSGFSIVRFLLTIILQVLLLFYIWCLLILPEYEICSPFISLRYSTGSLSGLTVFLFQHVHYIQCFFR